MCLKKLIISSIFLLTACKSVTNESKPIISSNNEVIVNHKLEKNKLELATKNISFKNFIFLTNISEIPVAYIKKDQIKIINLDPEISFLINDISFELNNSSVGIIKYKLFDKNKNSIDLIQKIKGFKTVENEIKSLNQIIKNIKKIEYIGNKENFNHIKLNNSDFVFEGLSNNYKFDVIKSSSVNKDLESLEIEYQIYKNEKIKSDVQKVTLLWNNFNWKNKLNNVAQNITLDYSGDKSKTFVENIDKTKLVFNGFDKEKFDFRIISVSPKNNDNQIAVIKYVIKFKNNLKNQESDQVTKEINAFLKRLTQTELNKKIDSINLTTDRDVMLKNISSLDSIIINPSVSLKNDLKLIDIKITKKTESAISVKFKIKQKTGILESKEITKNINGFRTSVKTVSQLDSILSKTEFKYNGNKSKTEINKIDIKNIELLKLTRAYKINQFIAIPQSDQTVAEIILKISEIGETNLSNIRKFVITGFKASSEKVIELDKLAKKITASYNDAKNTAFTSFKDIKVNQIKFINNDELSKYKININPLMILSKEKTKITIYYNLQEIDTNNKSNTHKIDITGFITTNQKLDNLDSVTTKIVVSYPQVKPKNPSDIDQSKIDFSKYDKSKYDLIIKKVDYDDELNELNEIDKSKIYVDFILKEKSSGFESRLRSKSITFEKS